MSAKEKFSFIAPELSGFPAARRARWTGVCRSLSRFQIQFWLLVASGVSPVFAQQVPPPRLKIDVASAETVRISWPAEAGLFDLEETAALTPPIQWQPMLQSPTTLGTESFLTLSTSQGTRYYRLRQTEPLRIASTSPAHGETGVAVTRETIVRFTRALSPNTQLDNVQFYAGFGERRILSRVQLASDRRTLTLFYLEPLPASARIRVTLHGAGLEEESGRGVDLDGDGFPGGSATLDFTTLGITPVAGTAVIGRVFASELAPGPNGGSVNRPLGGVTITVDGAEETLRTTTDAMGNFKLDPCPAGRFFVHVDGRTAEGSNWPNGAYYPAVGKAWEAARAEPTTSRVPTAKSICRSCAPERTKQSA